MMSVEDRLQHLETSEQTNIIDNNRLKKDNIDLLQYVCDLKRENLEANKKLRKFENDFKNVIGFRNVVENRLGNLESKMNEMEHRADIQDDRASRLETGLNAIRQEMATSNKLDMMNQRISTDLSLTHVKEIVDTVNTQSSVTTEVGQDMNSHKTSTDLSMTHVKEIQGAVNTEGSLTTGVRQDIIVSGTLPALELMEDEMSQIRDNDSSTSSFFLPTISGVSYQGSSIEEAQNNAHPKAMPRNQQMRQRNGNRNTYIRRLPQINSNDRFGTADRDFTGSHLRSRSNDSFNSSTAPNLTRGLVKMLLQLVSFVENLFMFLSRIMQWESPYALRMNSKTDFLKVILFMLFYVLVAVTCVIQRQFPFLDKMYGIGLDYFLNLVN